MNVSLKDKKIEALERMKILGVPFEIVQRFIKDGEVYACEPPFGEFCEISGGDKKRIDDFEKLTYSPRSGDSAIINQCLKREV